MHRPHHDSDAHSDANTPNKPRRLTADQRAIQSTLLECAAEYVEILRARILFADNLPSHIKHPQFIPQAITNLRDLMNKAHDKQWVAKRLINISQSVMTATQHNMGSILMASWLNTIESLSTNLVILKSHRLNRHNLSVVSITSEELRAAVDRSKMLVKEHSEISKTFAERLRELKAER